MIQVRTVSWEEAAADLRDIRREVFVLEQQVPEQDEWDSYDSIATHFIATDSAGAVLGTARFLPRGKITRMAVRKLYRRHRVGSHILATVLRYAANNGFESVFLDAQISAAPFYERFGFVREGTVFQDAGIDHIRMLKTNPGSFDEY